MNQVTEMKRKGWKPVEARSCTGKVDKDGRPVTVWYWMKVRKIQ